MISTTRSSAVVGGREVGSAYLMKEGQVEGGLVELERAEVGNAVQVPRGCVRSAGPFHLQRCILHFALLLLRPLMNAGRLLLGEIRRRSALKQSGSSCC